MDYITFIRSHVGKEKIFLNAAACILVDEHNRVLLQHRGDDHFWGLPGGIMELGETMEETCIREVREETGFDIEIVSFLGAYHNPHKVWPNGDQAHIICHVFIGTIIGGTMMIDNDETLALEFVAYSNLPPIAAPDHLEAIEDYYRQ